MTNARQHMMNLMAMAMCTSCSIANETLLHVLRYCQYLEVVWGLLLPQTMYNKARSLPLLEWIRMNIQGRINDSQNVVWDARFTVMTLLVLSNLQSHIG